MPDEIDPFALEVKQEQDGQRLQQNLSGALAVNPDRQAELNKLSAKSGVPALAIDSADNEAWVKSQTRMQDLNPQELVKTHPMTAGALADENFAKIAHDDVENIKGLEDSFSMIGKNSSSTVDDVLAMTEKQGAYAGYLMLAYGPEGQDIDAMAQFIADRNRPLADAQANAPQYMRDFQKRFKDADGMLEGAGVMMMSPRAMGRTAIGQLPNSLLPAVTTLAGAKTGASIGAGAGASTALVLGQAGPQVATPEELVTVPLAAGAGGTIGGLVGGGAGTFAGSSLVEIAAWIDQSLAEKNIDVTDAGQIANAFRDPEFIAGVKAQAETKGLTTAGIDTLWNTTFAGRFAKGMVPIKSARDFGGNVAKAGADVGVGALGESVSEAGGQLAATGEVDGKDALLEGVSSLGTSVFDTKIYKDIRQGDISQAGKAVANQKILEVQGVHDAAIKMKTLQRDPAAIRAMVEKANPDAKVYVDGAVAVTYFQELDPQTKATLKAAIPDIEEKIQESAASGADVMLNRSDYVAYIAGSENGKLLIEHVKFDRPDELTAAQLQDPEFMNGLYEDAAPNADDAAQDEITQFQERITQEMLDSGRIGSRDLARASTTPLAQFVRTMKERGGSEAVTQSLVDGIQVEGPVQVARQFLDVSDKQINDMREYADRIQRLSIGQEKAMETRRAKAMEKSQKTGQPYKEPRVSRGPGQFLPVLSYLNKIGGVKTGSPLAAELKVMDITPKTAPWLFVKESRKVTTFSGVKTIPALESVDNLDLTQFQEALGSGTYVKPGSTNANDTTAYYADQAWVLEAIDNELRGKPVVEKPMDPESVSYDYFLQHLDYLGLDLANATNEQIKAALAKPVEFQEDDATTEDSAVVQEDGRTFNQAADKTDTPAFKKWFGDSKVVDEDGKPLVVYHGTTADFEKFDPEKANPESDVGAGFYFTNTVNDVGINYAGYGPDLSAKIEREAENIAGLTDREYNDPDVRAEAKAKFATHDGATLPVYLSIKNPVYLGGDNDTFLEISEPYDEDTDEYGEPEGKLFEFVEALREISSDYIDADAEQAASAIYDMAGGDGISAADLHELLRNEEDGGMSYATDFDGNLANGEIIRRAFEAIGFDGIIDSLPKEKFINMDGMDENTVHYIAFKPEQIKSVFNAGTFDANDPRILAQQNRGQVSMLRDGRYIIKLFETSNLSTMLHETGHVFLDGLNRYASAPDAPEQIKADMDTVFKYLEVENYEAIQTEQHEKFARAFENYLRSGEAPSVALQGVFRQFKAWLTRIYRTVQELRAPVTDELRAVFDRMLATDEEISQVGRGENFRLDDGVLDILTAAEKERYQKLHNKALEQAKERLLAKTMRQKERETTQAWRDERKAVRAQMEEEVNSDPVYRSIQFLTKGVFLPGDNVAPPPPVKINKADAEKVLGKTIMKRLPRGMFSKSGISADAVSQAMSYVVGNGEQGYRNASGSELLWAMVNAEGRQDRIERMTNEEMVKRHGDLLVDGTIEQVALETYTNDAQALKLEMEGKVAAKLAGLPFGSNANFELAAQKILGSKKIQESANADRFYRASVKAARAYGKAVKGKDYAAAVKAKQQQLLSHHLYKQSLQARRVMEKTMDRWKRLTRPDEKMAKSIQDLNYVYVARAILGRYGVLPYNPGNLQTYFGNIQRDDPEAYEDLLLAVQENTNAIPEAVSREVTFTKGKMAGKTVTQTSQPWTRLSLDEFLGLKDVIDNVLGVGQRQKQVMIDGQKMEIAQVQADLENRIRDLPSTSINDGSQKAQEWHDKGKLAISSLKAGLRRVENWTQVMDGLYGGVFRKYIWNPINDARGQYLVAKHEYLDKMVELLKPHDERLNDSGEIVGYEIGYKFHSKAELIGMMLHMGNESNWYKLYRGARGKGEWNPANLQNMIDRMNTDGTLTKEDWDLVQGMWDLVETLKPQAQKQHREMYGYYFSEITSWPIQTPFGEYRGGYWPAVPDNNLSQDARIRTDKENLITVNNSSMFPSTGRGFTKGRVEGYAAPLQFDLKLLPSHIDKVLRFVHLEPAVKDVARIVNDKGFRALLDRVDPRAAEQMLIPWLQRVARQTVETNDSKWFGAIDPAARWLRSSASAQAMMLNFLNAIQQLTGFAPSVYKVGVRPFGRAFMQYAKNPMEAHRLMSESSEFMRYRSTILADNLQKNVLDIVLDRSKFSKVKDAAHAHGYIFQQVMQSWVDGTTWLAAHDKATTEGMNEKEAVRYADSLIRETQGSTSAEDIAKYEAGPATMRLFTMFYSYFNTQANLLLTEAQNIIRATSGRDRTMKLTYLYLMCYAVPSFMAEFIVKGLKGDLPDDDDDDGTVIDDYMGWYFGSQLRYGTAMIPWVGQAANATVNAFDEKPYNDRIALSPVVSTVETVAKTPKAIYDAAFDDGDVSRAVQNFMTSVGFLTGLPLGQLGKPLGYAADVAEGDAQIDSPLDPIRGMIAGPPPADKR